MAFIYDEDVAYTCGSGSVDSDEVTAFVAYEVTDEGETFNSSFKDGGLSISCSKALAKELASLFASLAE